MRLLSPNTARATTPAPRRFSSVVNQVHVIALKYATGKEYPSNRPGMPPQVMYTLTDGRVAWFSVEVAHLIDNLALVPGELFSIVNRGTSRGWEVTRVPPAQEPDQIPAAVPDEPAAVAVAAPATKLEHALKTAIAAAHAAEKFSNELGYPVRFDADAIKSMAITLVINSADGRR